MILCVNPNAAVDKTLVVENYRLGAIHRPSYELALPGGKGCNVARAAHTLGQPVTVTGWVGGYAGHFIEAGLQAEGIQTDFVHTTVESRDCISILDPATGAMTEIYEKGRPVTPAEVEAFYTTFGRWLPKARLVTLSGSLPPGVPLDFYAELIRLAHTAGVRVILDSSGDALRNGVEDGRPDMLKCNRAELSALVKRPLEDLNGLRAEVSATAQRLHAAVIVTLGAAGAVAAEPGGRLWLAQSPRVEAISAVGSGDAFLGGLACGLLAEQSFAGALSLAVAAGAANTLQIGAGRLRQDDVEQLIEQVRVAES